MILKATGMDKLTVETADAHHALAQNSVEILTQEDEYHIALTDQVTELKLFPEPDCPAL